jgi:hypothetical protein
MNDYWSYLGTKVSDPAMAWEYRASSVKKSGFIMEHKSTENTCGGEVHHSPNEFPVSGTLW